MYDDNELERLRILIFQYILFKGDFYDERSKTALYKLQHARKHLSSSEYVEIYRDFLTAEIFNQMAVDLSHLLDMY